MSGAVASGSLFSLPTTGPVRRQLHAVSGPESLTRREMQVIESWIRHGSNKLVAHELGISTSTVKNHAAAVVRKLDAQSMGQAAVRFDRWSVHGGERRSGLERRSGRDRRVADA